MSGNERDDRGVLDAVAARESASTTEIAEEVGITCQTAVQRLRQLEERGAVTSRKIGTSLVWNFSAVKTAIENVDPDDDFWDAETYEGEEMSAENLDETLYS